MRVGVTGIGREGEVEFLQGISGQIFAEEIEAVGK
jgi:hypothetical protein